MNTQTATAQPLAIQDTPETIPAAVIAYQRHEDIAQDITSRYPHAEAVIMRGLEIAHTVQIESGEWEASRRELSGHHMATVNGHAVRKAQRGGSNWNSPPAWDTLTCSCESYEYSSGTATITKPAAWDVDPTAPKSHDHKICKHIAAYAIVKQDNIELKAAADEAADALAAELFASVDTAETVGIMELTKPDSDRREIYRLDGMQVSDSQLHSMDIELRNANKGAGIARDSVAMETKTYSGGLFEGTHISRIWAVQ